MKTFRFIPLAFLLTFALTVNAQNSFFEKYNDNAQVQYLYISKAMMSMPSNSYSMSNSIKKVASQLDAIYMISTMSSSIKKQMRNDFSGFARQKRYELLMKQRGWTTSNTIYILRNGRDRIKELLMVRDGAATLKYTLLQGNMTLKDIQDITNQHLTSDNEYGDFKSSIFSDGQEEWLKKMEKIGKKYYDKYKNYHFNIDGDSIKIYQNDTLKSVRPIHRYQSCKISSPYMVTD